MLLFMFISIFLFILAIIYTANKRYKIAFMFLIFSLLLMPILFLYLSMFNIHLVNIDIPDNLNCKEWDTKGCNE